MRDKKGQVNTLAPAILSLVFAAVVLVFGLVMTQELRDTQDNVAVTVANESFNLMKDNVNQTADRASGCNFNSFTIANAWNLSSGTVINSSCYTTYVNGNIVYTDCGSTEGFNRSHWNISYTYNWGDQACISANETLVGLGTFADFWEIIVLAIVITVVIGLLLVIFGGAGRRR